MACDAEFTESGEIASWSQRHRRADDILGQDRCWSHHGTQRLGWLLLPDQEGGVMIYVYANNHYAGFAAATNEQFW